MYHHQGKHGFSAETSVPPDRHLLVPGMNVHAEMGLVLSTDAKPRLKWTSELHQRFVEAVDQLGGAEKATPKAVMKLMAIPGLTLYHLKSHLQKYRLSKSMHGQADKSNNKNGCITTADGMPVGRATFTNNSGRASPTNKGLQMGEALQMQIDVQRRLHEQLEVQRHLQLRIEAQGKYLQSVLEKAEETLGIKNLGPEELKAAKLPISELAPKASNECLDPDLLELKRTPCLGIPQTQVKQTTDCSIDSCLTSCEGSHKEQEIYNIGDTPVCHKEESSRPEETELAWCTDSIKSRMLLSEMFPIQRTTSNLSTGGVHGKRGNRSTTYEARWKERDAEEGSHGPSKTKRHATPLGNEKPAKEFRFQDLTVQLDLNDEDKNDAASSSKDFDLNGFNWN